MFISILFANKTYFRVNEKHSRTKFSFISERKPRVYLVLARKNTFNYTRTEITSPITYVFHGGFHEIFGKQPLLSGKLRDEKIQFYKYYAKLSIIFVERRI